MRIIEETKQEEIITTCPHCGTKIGYTVDDTFQSFEGLYIECPKCGKDIVATHYSRPLQFPDAYYHFGDGVKISNEEIEQWVKNCVKRCDGDEDFSYSYEASGDTMVIVQSLVENGEKEYDIIVAKDYWHTTITQAEARELIK